MGILVGLHQTTDARPRNAMLLRDLRQRHPGAAVEDGLLPVHVQPRPPDLAALQLRPAHARPHALDDDVQRSSSAIADTMTMMALPSGPSVSIASRLREELDAERRKRP